MIGCLNICILVRLFRWATTPVGCGLPTSTHMWTPHLHPQVDCPPPPTGRLPTSTHMWTAHLHPQVDSPHPPTCGLLTSTHRSTPHIHPHVDCPSPPTDGLPTSTHMWTPHLQPHVDSPHYSIVAVSAQLCCLFSAGIGIDKPDLLSSW